MKARLRAWGMRHHGACAGRLTPAERPEQVPALDRDRQPVHQRAGHPDRRTGLGGEGETLAETPGDVPGPSRRGELDPRRSDLGAQLVDLHGGHARAGRTQQPARQLLPDRGRHGLPGRRLEQHPDGFAVECVQPDRYRPAAGVVGEHHKDPFDDKSPVAQPSGLGLGMRDANRGHERPPGGNRDEVRPMRGDVLAQPAARLVQARLDRAGRVGDPLGGQVGVIEQGDGLPLAGRQFRDRRADRVGAIEVVGRGQAVRRTGMKPLGPIGQQHHRGPARHRTVDVDHDAAEPAREPVRIPQPVQRHERLQERLLHDVVHVIWTGAQPCRVGARHRPVPFHQQPERHRVVRPGQPDQVAVRDLHTR